ncbi:MAG: AAA family ATPase [Solirubrobacteraceae bacterium]
MTVTDPAFLRSAVLLEAGPQEERAGYPWTLPAVAALAEGVSFDPQVTFFVGENGSGKSTLIEAIAVAAGMNPEGGGSNFNFGTRSSHSVLGEAVRLVRGVRRPRTDFFLRAESLFTTATWLESLPRDPLASYGGRSLHEMSHGDSFLAVVLHRFGGDGLYILDEPEAALSVQNQLTVLRRIDELVRAGSQFVIATHSPILLSYPRATIYEFTDGGMRRVAYGDADLVRLARGFLDEPDRFLRRLLD